MPGRPTKDWFDRCVNAVSQSRTAIDPRRICGATWQKMNEADRRAIAKLEKRSGRYAERFPSGLYLIFDDRGFQADAPTPTTGHAMARAMSATAHGRSVRLYQRVFRGSAQPEYDLIGVYRKGKKLRT